MFKVVQKFTVMDKFEAKYKIAEIEYSGLPPWVSVLIPMVDRLDVRFAIDRHVNPLVRKLQFTPSECLDRLEHNSKLCTLRKGCFGWRVGKCTDLKRNTCDLLVIPGATEEESSQLTELVNLWRDRYYPISVKTDSVP